uniref:Uncharacterized protein n=1 Tax=Sphaerodactylus townsendi TaxID=933632 RepID=A0ACB8EJP4_9SAUR
MLAGERPALVPPPCLVHPNGKALSLASSPSAAPATLHQVLGMLAEPSHVGPAIRGQPCRPGLGTSSHLGMPGREVVPGPADPTEEGSASAPRAGGSMSGAAEGTLAGERLAPAPSLCLVCPSGKASYQPVHHLQHWPRNSWTLVCQLSFPFGWAWVGALSGTQWGGSIPVP